MKPKECMRRTEWYTGFVSCDGALLLEPLTVGAWKNNMCVEDVLVAAIYAMTDCEKGTVAAGTVAGPGGKSGPLRVHFNADVMQASSPSPISVTPGRLLTSFPMAFFPQSCNTNLIGATFWDSIQLCDFGTSGSCLGGVRRWRTSSPTLILTA